MKYVLALDGLRGVAILIVMLFHWKVPFFSGGFIGVDLFFALSGYLITSILMHEFYTTGDVSLKGFYIRRILRLFPALAALIFAYLLLLPFTDNWKERLLDAVFVITYTSNFSMYLIDRPKILAHTWSLCVEEQFYLLWPAPFLLLSRKLSRTVLLASCLVLAASLTLNRVLFADPKRIYVSLDTRGDTILYGCALAIWLYGKRPPKSTVIPIVGWFGFIVFMTSDVVRDAAGLQSYSLVAILATLLVLAAIQKGMSQIVLSWTPLVWLGKRSYGLYLWHFPIMGFFRSDVSGWKLLPAAALTFAITEASYRLVELPFLRLKKHFSDPARTVPPIEAGEVDAAVASRN